MTLPTRSSARTVTTPLEALAVTAICFGISIYASLQAVASNFPVSTGAFSDSGFIWLVCIELTLGAVALGFLHARRYAVASLVPAPTAKGAVAGIGLYFVIWCVYLVLLTPFAADPQEQPVALMVQDARLTLPVVIMLAMVNGVYEEIFLLGFLLNGLRGYGLSIALGAMLLVRVLCHLYQGPMGALSILFFGLVLGLYYIRYQLLWPPVFAHILGDIVPFLGSLQ